MRNRYIYIKCSKVRHLSQCNTIRKIIFLIVDDNKSFDMENNALLIVTFKSSKEFGICDQYIWDFK